MDPRDLIKRPIITEKSTQLMEEGKYVFEVDKRANKVEIRQAVEKLFGVKVAQVWTMRVPGKRKRVGRFVGRTSEWKKAIVKLTPDSKPIELFGESSS
ncbi:50S ribosomal protein L23 [Alicyclobacillus cellulosilyticus]|uniref:Large ribosomal subunit protein uL23 n=1 Tax=Alicyclobacillus cellulosilyticus TaxID=1003997 RepID=A0A917K6T8_9BACL|nr:50S ribosomal protein L23 [Alicyclobacillus cellulosilyticus]GGJ01097.1 50S ribosomal protein L23 [Alicyclobacillus cellulosilyticus]